MGQESPESVFIECNAANSDQLTLAVIELALVTFMFVNVFFHLCARNWSLGALLVHVSIGVMELTATIMAILFYVRDHNQEWQDSIGTHSIIMYVAGGLSFIRLLFAFISCCVRKAVIAEEKGSSWDLFWPVFEMIASAVSTLALITLAFVMRQCLTE